MTRSRYVIPSVQRAARILHTVATADRPLSISELSRILDLPKSSVFRIVITLELEGFLERLEDDRFRVGVSAFEVGSVYTTRFDLESAFHEVAQRLVREHNEVVQLAILIGTDILYIGKEDCSQPVRLVSRVGTRLPAHTTSLGKALLSGLSEEELHSLYPDGRLTQMTPHSHTSLASLIDDLQRVRERGWAHDNEETAIGLQCVGSPICDEGGRPIAAVSIAVPSQRMSAERLVQLGEAVKGTASEIASSSDHSWAQVE
jgi:DNA-binding IclR family transcriptional regulator